MLVLTTYILFNITPPNIPYPHRGIVVSEGSEPSTWCMDVGTLGRPLQGRPRGRLVAPGVAPQDRLYKCLFSKRIVWSVQARELDATNFVTRYVAGSVHTTKASLPYAISSPSSLVLLDRRKDSDPACTTLVESYPGVHPRTTRCARLRRSRRSCKGDAFQSHNPCICCAAPPSGDGGAATAPSVGRGAGSR